MTPDWTDDDLAWLRQCHVEAEGPCDHDHCLGCSCACHKHAVDIALAEHALFERNKVLRTAADHFCDITEANAVNLALIESLNRDIDIERMARKAAESKVAELTDERNTYRNWLWMCMGTMVAMLIIAASAWGT